MSNYNKEKDGNGINAFMDYRTHQVWATRNNHIRTSDMIKKQFINLSLNHSLLPQSNKCFLQLHSLAPR